MKIVGNNNENNDNARVDLGTNFARIDIYLSIFFLVQIQLIISTHVRKYLSDLHNQGHDFHQNLSIYLNLQKSLVAKS